MIIPLWTIVLFMLLLPALGLMLVALLGQLAAARDMTSKFKEQLDGIARGSIHTDNTPLWEAPALASAEPKPAEPEPSAAPDVEPVLGELVRFTFEALGASRSNIVAQLRATIDTLNNCPNMAGSIASMPCGGRRGWSLEPDVKVTSAQHYFQLELPPPGSAPMPPSANDRLTFSLRARHFTRTDLCRLLSAAAVALDGSNTRGSIGGYSGWSEFLWLAVDAESADV